MAHASKTTAGMPPPELLKLSVLCSDLLPVGSDRLREEEGVPSVRE